jgi:predicted nucleic acid-binding protein
VADVVVDASAMVDALAGTPLGPAVTDRLRDHTLHAPARLDAEVLSALGRLQLYARLADDLAVPLVTTDTRLAIAAAKGELIELP